MTAVQPFCGILKSGQPSDRNLWFFCLAAYTDPLQNAGDLHYVDHGTFLIVEGDTTGDGKADFQIEVHGSTFLTSDDFLG